MQKKLGRGRKEGRKVGPIVSSSSVKNEKSVNLKGGGGGVIWGR